MCDKTCSGVCNPHNYDDVEKIAKFLKTQMDLKPLVGIVCGTGLGDVVSLVCEPVTLDYRSIPGFSTSTVQGHDGKLTFGYIGPTPVVCMQGRFHLFEGYPLWKVVLPIRVMKLLGITTLILSNAAGSINHGYKVGDIMFIKDHINFVNWGGNNPLQGPNDARFGPRFVAINDAYDKQILKIAKATAKELRLKAVQEGVYACLGGPSYETVAELRALKMLGADCVGMSTVHEVITARHCGIKCFAFSLITNKCVLEYENDNKPNHDEILSIGREKQEDVKTFVEKLFTKLRQNHIF